MWDTSLIESLQNLGVGRRGAGDELFGADRLPAKCGVCDVDDEDLCHELAPSACAAAGCAALAASLLDAENHYNAAHRYCCRECRRALPSAHLLDLHVQEAHDSFFAVLAARKPSYCCYIQECTSKFSDAERRLEHCVAVHRLPKDFRFESKLESIDPRKKKRSVDAAAAAAPRGPRPPLHNTRGRGSVKFSGRIFTSERSNRSATEANVDEIMSDLRESLPQ